MLRHRAQLLRQIRQFFDQRGFFEVQTPCLSADTVVDVFLDPPRVASSELGLPTLDLPAQMHLQTSPEFAMKRLVAAGAHAIYQIGPVFRAGERGKLHNPEFTMLEWYRVGDTAADAIDLLDALSQATLASQPCVRLTYREAFQQHMRFDPIEADLPSLVAAVSRHDPALAIALEPHRDGLLDAIFSLDIQPKLLGQAPHIVSNYPLSQAALARQSAVDPATAERFEWFSGGIELANGYGELLDPDLLYERAVSNNAERARIGRSSLPANSRLEAAMRDGLPSCAGVAVGLDRLLMVQQGASSIEEVLAFPIERA